MPAYLETILAAHRAHAALDDRDLEAAIGQAAGSGPVRSFDHAIRTAAGRDGVAVIAEIKRRSPSKGDLDPDLDPARVAVEYEAGGAACLSVLTDVDFFGSRADDLDSARTACSIPVLRKDFTIGPLDVCDARTMGADAVLLIVAALSDTELESLIELAGRLSLAALVEVHDADELKRAVAAGADLIGVNQRDLGTFEVDPRRALDLREAIPTDTVTVAESGIAGRQDVRRLAESGYHAVLVGETLLRSPDRRVAVAELLGT
jgi:indole-3-glycerol phosphate synthase